MNMPAAPRAFRARPTVLANSVGLCFAIALGSSTVASVGIMVDRLRSNPSSLEGFFAVAVFYLLIGLTAQITPKN